MACDLTQGRKAPCKDVVGGITAVYFADFGDAGAATLGSDGEVTDFANSFTVYKYELKGNSSFEQSINSSRENGTTFFEQTLNLTLPKLSKEDNNEIKLLAYGRPQIFVQDYNDNCFAVGLEHGAEVTGGTIVTGAAMGDLSGYTLSFTAQEVLPANFLNGATAASPFGGLATSTVTVTEGTNS
jgi:hypothetical protein